MKKINAFVACLCWMFIFLAGTISAQQLPTTLHVKLEESTNADALVSTGNIHKAADGGYLIAGTWGNDEYARAVLVKTNNEFLPVWSVRLDQTLNFGNSFQASYGIDVVELGNDEYAFLAGVNMNVFSNSPVLQNLDFGFVKFKRDTLSNTILAANRFGTDYNEVPHSMIRTADGGFMLCGYSNLEQALNLPSKALTFLVKLDENGDQEWAKRFKNQASECNTSGLGIFLGMMRRNVIQTQDGGYVFTMHCDENVYITKVDHNGTELWSKTFASSAGFADGSSNDVGAIGVATGAGGTIIGVRELANGDLAFLGNQFAYFISLLILDGNSSGAGLYLPFSYVFTTNASGVFKKGAAFFHERFNDQNQPIEMLATDFEVQFDNRFIISAGVDQFGDGNGNSYFKPAFVELDVTKQDIDESVIRAAKVGEEFPAYYVNDNARGMSNIRMSYDPAHFEIALSYDLKHDFKIKEYLGVNTGTGCVDMINNMHSFAFTLNLSDYEMVSSDVNGGAFTPTINDINVSRIINCAEPPVATENIPEAASADIAAIVPTVNDGNFNIVIRNDAWLGAEICISDLAGQAVYRNVATGQVNEVQGTALSSGMYIVRLRKAGQQVVMRTIVQR